MTSSFVCSKVVGVEPRFAGIQNVCAQNQQVNKGGAPLPISIEVEGEPLKAKWCLKAVGLTGKVINSNTFLKTNVKKKSVYGHGKWTRRKRKPSRLKVIASSEVFGRTALVNHVSCKRMVL